MKRRIYAIVLAVMFLGITAYQYRLSYEFRIKPPSGEWSKEVLVSSGKVALYNYPKLVSYNQGYVVAHDDGNKLRVIMLDGKGKSLNDKVFDAEDKAVRDVNLLTDGEYLYVNWIVNKNGIDNILNIKLDKSLNLVEKWMTNDVGETAQIGENILVVAFNNRIEVQDIKSKKVASINTPSPSKLAGTLTRYGYMITYYVPYKAGVRDINGFFCFYFNDGKASQPVNIMERPTSSSELFFNTAAACDNENGYIIIERRNKSNFSSNLIITFPIGNGPGDTSTAGKGMERALEVLPTDQFLYSPGSISSGNEARFIIGYARKFGRTTRQFNLLDFSLKGGKVTKTEYASRTRQASNSPYFNGDMVVYSSLVKGNDYQIYISSQSEAFKLEHNGVRRDEIGLALLDIVLELLNAIFSLFTLGLRWIIPGLVLISLMSMFGYRFNIKNKKIIFSAICIVSTALKLYCVYDTYYKTYIKNMPGVLGMVHVGLGISLVVSIFSYLYGSGRYYGKLNRDEDAIPFVCFGIALFIDSILTQLVFTPFIM